MDQIKLIVDLNKIANNNTHNYHLANSMLVEELAETVLAMKNKDYTEMLDWILDIFFIWIGELHKVWFSSEQINEALSRIIENNYSKFTKDELWTLVCKRDPNWKIMKPEWFKPVDISDIIPNKKD